MSDYVFLVGDDYDSSNKEYVLINSDKGQQISIALAASGIPFKGRFDKERMLFNYDGVYKESVDELSQNSPRTIMLNSAGRWRSIRAMTVFISCLLSQNFCV